MDMIKIKRKKTKSKLKKLEPPKFVPDLDKIKQQMQMPYKLKEADNQVVTMFKTLSPDNADFVVQKLDQKLMKKITEMINLK